MQVVCEAANVKVTDYQSMMNYFKKTITKPTGLNFLDLTYFSAFEQPFGFRVEFEVLHGVKPWKDSVF